MMDLMARWFRKSDNKPLSMRRRLKFTSVVLVSQILLIALAIAWLIHMIVIAIYGAVYFIERDPLMIWIEISASALITLFAIFVLIMQIRRLGERRRNDRDNY
jgi:ABC-type nickel/cobalt efflux system permease component RcnA